MRKKVEQFLKIGHNKIEKMEFHCSKKAISIRLVCLWKKTKKRMQNT